MFINILEVNYKFVIKNTLSKVFLKKMNKNNNFILNNFRLELFFWFKQIEDLELNFIKIYNHVLLLWLITNNIANIKSFNSTLDRGVRYYRFMLKVKVINIYNFFDFLIENLLPIVLKKSFNLIDERFNIFLFVLTDLNPFVNIRLSNSLYLNLVSDKLYLNLNLNNKYVINLLKLA